MKKNKKRNRMYLLILLLLGISIGFAALATTLKINGSASINKNTWSVYWANVGDEKGVTTPKPQITDVDENNPNTLVSFGVTLDKPGDFYEFQVDAVNAGSIDAMLSVISKTVTSNGTPATLPDYVKYSVTYADGSTPVEKNLLAKNTTERYKVRIEFLTSVTQEDLEKIPEDGLEYTIDINIPYIQADDTATERAISLCRKATVLHTEVCDPTEEASDTNYCTSANHNRGDIVTYGNINNTNNLTAGDAYDCDVDNSGTWDKDERFYYLYNIDSETAALIFYNNVKQGEPNEAYTNAYDLNNDAYTNGPQTARSDLPTEAQWPNVKLKSKIVNIYDNRGNLKKNDFSYEGYAARLISVKELDLACNSNFENDPSYSGYGEKGALDSCEFLMENTYYTEKYTSGSDSNTTNPGYWTDTAYQYTTSLAMFVSTSGRMLGGPPTNMTYGIRPVIEVPVAELTK